MKFSSAALAALAMSSSVVKTLGIDFAGTIKITNLAPTMGTLQTPVWVGIHDGTFDIYNRGEASSPELEELAEDGTVGPISTLFAAGSAGREFDGATPGGPFGPGETRELPFTVSGASGPLYFSYASMVLPSNDAFVANGNPMAHKILTDTDIVKPFSFIVKGDEVLDAGTEVNDELAENVAGLPSVDPGSGNQVGNIPFNGEDENGVILVHPGFNPGGNILTARPGADFKQPDYQMMKVEVIIETVNGEVFVPSVTSGGDPHFRRWNGSWYDFMGACDLVLLLAPVFTPESPLSINIRTKIRRAYSYIESAVVKLGEDTLQVSSFGDYIYNGVSNVDTTMLSVGGFPVKYSRPSDNEHLFEIEVSDNETIALKTFKDMVSVTIDHADPDRYRHSVGMMGSFDQHGLMVGRDGKTVFEDPVAMAAEWQVKDDEPMLFQSVRSPQYPTQCIMPDVQTTEFRERRRLGESHIREAAEKACAHWSEDIREACIYDVIATGDLELATAGAF